VQAAKPVYYHRYLTFSSIIIIIIIITIIIIIIIIIIITITITITITIITISSSSSSASGPVRSQPLQFRSASLRFRIRFPLLLSTPPSGFECC